MNILIMDEARFHEIPNEVAHRFVHNLDILVLRLRDRSDPLKQFKVLKNRAANLHGDCSSRELKELLHKYEQQLNPTVFG